MIISVQRPSLTFDIPVGMLPWHNAPIDSVTIANAHTVPLVVLPMMQFVPGPHRVLPHYPAWSTSRIRRSRSRSRSQPLARALSPRNALAKPWVPIPPDQLLRLTPMRSQNQRTPHESPRASQPASLSRDALWMVPPPQPLEPQYRVQRGPSPSPPPKSPPELPPRVLSWSYYSSPPLSLSSSSLAGIRNETLERRLTQLPGLPLTPGQRLLSQPYVGLGLPPASAVSLNGEDENEGEDEDFLAFAEFDGEVEEWDELEFDPDEASCSVSHQFLAEELEGYDSDKDAYVSDEDEDGPGPALPERERGRPPKERSVSPPADQPSTSKGKGKGKEREKEEPARKRTRSPSEDGKGAEEEDERPAKVCRISSEKLVVFFLIILLQRSRRPSE